MIMQLCYLTHDSILTYEYGRIVTIFKWILPQHMHMVSRYFRRLFSHDDFTTLLLFQ
jgi:hypothetical protein